MPLLDYRLELALDPADRQQLMREAWQAITPRGPSRVWFPHPRTKTLALHLQLADRLADLGYLVGIRTPIPLGGDGDGADLGDHYWQEMFEEDEERALVDGSFDESGEGQWPELEPALTLVGHAVSIELDNAQGRGPKWELGDTPNRHFLPDGIADDYARDVLCFCVGHRVLRIRRPGAPTIGAWPWRVETTTQSVTVLADMILGALHDPARPWTPTRGATTLQVRN